VGDDTTLGWVYQYWNDPEREALDAKIAGGGKIEPHEIASKTQMFTERYMVEWLLQNSLGLTWLSICKKNGWTPDAAAVVARLEERRAAWRDKREKGEVALDALMPIAPASEDGGLEEAWKYYVPQPLSEDAPGGAAAKAPASIREVKILDPACGSGHFLVIAFGLLQVMYREEARHRGEAWSDEDIARWIVEANLHGVDIDPRAVQIAAAALWLRAKLACGPGVSARLGRMNLVAPAFGLGALPKDDPALVTLYEELGARGVPRSAVESLVTSLRGVDYMGTLLRVDRAIAGLVEGAEDDGPLLGWGAKQHKAALEATVAEFLDAHAAEADLGLRLEGEQLAAGLRFVQVVREGRYDVVVGNPPYQGLTKTSKAFEAVAKAYPRGKADLYAAFLERGLELVKDGGLSALLTMRGWMFLGQFEALRKWVLHEQDLRAIGDFDRGAFDEVPNEVLAVAMPVIRRALPGPTESVAVLPTPLADKSYDRQRTHRKRAAVLAHVGRHTFDPRAFTVIDGEPLVYWWTPNFLARYASAPKLGDVSPARFGLNTGDNVRFLRLWWEIEAKKVPHGDNFERPDLEATRWARYLKGASGVSWMDPVDMLMLWAGNGLETKLLAESLYGSHSRQIRNEACYWRRGVAFTMIGSDFSARMHRYPAIIDSKGSSVYSDDVADVCCLMNRAEARAILNSLNPTVSFQVGDVNRLAMFSVGDASSIVRELVEAFGPHEVGTELSAEFRQAQASAWRYAQDWAQRAVDRPEGAPLPPYEPEYDPPAPEAFVSFAVGIALGRFGANGAGILDAAPKDALPDGILFVGPGDTLKDSLAHLAAARIAAAWEEHGPAILEGEKLVPLRDWLRKDFFAYHKGLYENRPIYFPLSSEKRSFVAWTSIHRWTDQTLQALMVDHLKPALTELAGALADLATARASSDKKTAVAADKQYTAQKRLHDELEAFLADVRQIAERGPEPTSPDAKTCPPREADAPFHMDLDDGVMINSAALWKLLAPQWADPKKWWTQLAKADGKDYDWAHLAKRYFPTRALAKCQEDPSLAVAHGCFWRYHPAKAYAWELRLQDEIRPDFTLDEPGSDEARAAFEKTHPAEAAAIRDKEAARRAKKAQKALVDDLPDAEAADEEEEAIDG
jgi:hypothetical protein